MYLWYKLSHVCYAYLTDIPTSSDVLGQEADDRETDLDSGLSLADLDLPDSDLADTESDSSSDLGDSSFDRDGLFERSRWFTRGWTLQELVAPQVLEFYAADWTEIGTKLSLSDHLSVITRIDIEVLRGNREPSDCLVAERMSWAARRTTTRIEDQAYSLLGIFNANMPLIYGEGSYAFQRLQEEVMKATEDYSLFAAHTLTDDGDGRNSYGRKIRKASSLILGVLASNYTIHPAGLFAEHPRNFNFRSRDLTQLAPNHSYLNPLSESDGGGNVYDAPLMTGRGLRIRLPIYRVTGKGAKTARGQEEEEFWLAHLHCSMYGRPLCVALRRESPVSVVYQRVLARGMWMYYSHVPVQDFKPTTIYIRHARTPFWKSSRVADLGRDHGRFSIRIDMKLPRPLENPTITFRKVNLYNPNSWTLSRLQHSPVVPESLGIGGTVFMRCVPRDAGFSFILAFAQRWCRVLALDDPVFPSNQGGLFDVPSLSLDNSSPVRSVVDRFLQNWPEKSDRSSAAICGYRVEAGWKTSGVDWGYVVLVTAGLVSGDS